MILRNVDFGNPVGLDDIPSREGIYLICTESSGGIKIIGVYHSDDMKKHISSNPWKETWKKYEDKDLFAYYSKEPYTYEARESKCYDIISTRFYEVPCVDKRDEGW